VKDAGLPQGKAGADYQDEVPDQVQVDEAHLPKADRERRAAIQPPRFLT
jgi:hypothetical protein